MGALDIDAMMRWGAIKPGAHLAGEIGFSFYDDPLDVKFESRVGDPWESWLRLKYAMADYWTGEELEIDTTFQSGSTECTDHLIVFNAEHFRRISCKICDLL